MGYQIRNPDELSTEILFHRTTCYYCPSCQPGAHSARINLQTVLLLSDQNKFGFMTTPDP
jgi:hypothetical protein